MPPKCSFGRSTVHVIMHVTDRGLDSDTQIQGTAYCLAAVPGMYVYLCGYTCVGPTTSLGDFPCSL